MRIAISGLSGCGTTTACTNVARALGLKVINYTMRDLARDLRTSLERVQELAKKDPVYDYTLEKNQMDLAAAQENCIIGTRLAGWIVDAVDLRVFLHASLETRAKRIAQREGKLFASVLAYTKKRDGENYSRYKRYYGIDTNDRDGFDLIVNTEYLSAAQVAALIVAAAKLASENNLQKPSKIAKRIKALVNKKLKGVTIQKLREKIAKER